MGKSLSFWAAVFLHVCTFFGDPWDQAAWWCLLGEVLVCLLSKVVSVADHNGDILAVLWDTLDRRE